MDSYHSLMITVITRRQIGAKLRLNRTIIHHIKTVTNNSVRFTVARKDSAVQFITREMAIDDKVEIRMEIGSEEIRVMAEGTIGRIAMTTERWVTVEIC